MNDTPRFGTAGLADSYTVKKFDPAAIPAYTAGFGLTAFEYQCGRGVRLAHDKAAALGAACAERDIALSVHAPYYISMSSLEEDKRLHSIDYLLQSCALVKALGGRRVIFHSGSCGKQSREDALEKALDTMARAVKACDEAGFEDCILCPETMGKVNQLGTLDEVLALCEVDPRITPCIDFGHLYARSCGVQFADATAAADYAALLDTLAARLGDDRAVHFHAHFSRIAYTKGGEKCHLTFADTAFGPPHAPLLALLKERHLAPTIICESAGTQAEDAAALSAGIADGTIDCVVTDHAPHALHEKECEFEIAPFGVVGLETSLPLMLTNLVATGKMTWQRLVEVMCVNPRKVARLAPVKVEAGSVADLTLIDPELELEVTPELFCGKQHNSAFMGAKLTGRATDTVVAGKHVLKDCKLA